MKATAMISVSTLMRSRRACVVLAAVFLLGAVLAIMFRAHLMWQYTKWQLELEDIRSIPVATMPVEAIPEEWVRTEVDGLELMLPPDIAAGTFVEPGNGISLFALQGETRSVIIEPVTDTSEFAIILDGARRVNSSGFDLSTIPRILIAAYSTGSDDFRWSMDSQEAMRHTFLVNCRRVIGFESASSAEALLRDDIDGVLQFAPNRVTFEWQCANGAHRGFIQFKGGDAIRDRSWMRAVCQSLRVNCASNSGR